MSAVACPCGFTVEDPDSTVTRRAYERHDCEYHDRSAKLCDLEWPEVVGILIALTFIAFLFSNGFGLIK